MASTTTTTTSKQFTLNLNDFWKGFIMAVLSPVFTILATSFNAGSLVFDWKAIGGVALIAMFTYLSKNLFTTSKIVINNAAPEVVQSVKDGNLEAKVVPK